MPYIEPGRRQRLNELVELMEKLHIKADGDLNYVLYAYCLRSVKAGYNNYKNFRAELRECADWIGQNLLVPYEFRKQEENGRIEGE